MTLAEALDVVIARTGVKRYRYLCLEHPKPSVRAEYSALVLRLAAERPEPRPTAAETLALALEVKRCMFRSKEPGGCGCGRCGLRNQAKVSTLECIECVRKYR
jgi:hypothetical protein